MNRFLIAQQNIYKKALDEIKKGRKRTHWMWFIFPQIYGLAMSKTAIKYELKSVQEARDYFANETLKARLIEISEAIYNLNGDIEYILDFPDNMKFKSCMTLFYLIAPEYKIFKNNLDRYFDGELCSHTL
jgi:uncharacterized protein (DUF1810 family)